MTSFIRRTIAVLSLLALSALAPGAFAEEVAPLSYDACRYAKHLITTPGTYYIGGVVGTPWLESAVCQETGEACALIGHLCGGDVPGYQNLENLCDAGEELKVCVPRTGLEDPNGVCVSFRDGCASEPDSCRVGSCSMRPWSPSSPPVPIVPGDGRDLGAQAQVDFQMPSYDRPEACVFAPKPGAGAQCSFRDNPEPRPCDPSKEICNFTTPPPPPTEHPCDGIADPELNACCNQHGGLSLEAIEECIPDSDDPSDACHIVVSVGGDVNGQMNVCCQYVNNNGVIQDSDVVQECKNVFGPGTTGEPNPGDPEGSESAGETFSCSVAALDSEKVDGKLISLNKEGLGIRLTIDHLAPAVAGAASVDIAQTEGPSVSFEGSASLPFASKTSWTVQMGRPETMMGDYIPNAAFVVTVRDASGGVLHQTSCRETAGIEAKGGSSGCSLVEGDMASQTAFVARSFVQWLLSAGALIPMACLRRLLSRGNRALRSRR